MADVFAVEKAGEQHEQKAADLDTEVRRLRVRLTALTVAQWQQVPDGQEITRRGLVSEAVRQLCALTEPPADAPAVWEADEAELPSRLAALLEAAQPRRAASPQHTEGALRIAVGLRRSL